MPLSAPAGPRGSKPPEENPPRIILVRPAEISRRGTLVRQDNCVSIDIEDDPDSVALSSQSQDPSGIEVVVDSLGEPHPSRMIHRAATDPGPAEGALDDERKNLKAGRNIKSAEAVLSQPLFQAKSSPAVPETNIVPLHESASGESISISSGIANDNEIRESEENEVQPAEPGPSWAHNSTSISFSDDDIGDLGEEIAGKETHENGTDSSSSNSLHPHENEANPSLNASNSQLNARMKRLLFGVVSKRPAQPEEIELHEIPSDQNQNLDLPEISTDFQPENNNAFALSDSYKHIFTTARDLASATSNISAQTQNERRGNGSSDPGGDGDSSGAESSTGRNRPRNSRMRGLVRMQMAARGMREDARRNAFVGTLSVFETMMQFGYYLGVIPFRVTFDGTKYVIKTSIPRQIFVFVMILVVIWCEARKALLAVEVVNIKDFPGSLFIATEEVVRIWLLIAYCFVLYWKQSKFLLAFEDFTHDFQRPQQNQPGMKLEVRAKDVAVVVCCIYLMIANWLGWTMSFFKNDKFVDFMAYNYDAGIFVGLRDFPNNQVYFWIVSSTFWVITTYSYVLKYYMEGILWASAYTLYSIEHKTRSYTMNDDEFEINEGTEMFRSVIKLVRDLNRTLGPLRVVQFLVLIPYLVNIAYAAGTGHFDLREIFQIPLQVGHFVLAAEASANMKNLIQHIVVFKIKLSPQQRQNPMAWHKLTVRQNFFGMIANTPIALEGMDFFEVSYVVLGNIAASVITYVLVILDWKRE